MTEPYYTTRPRHVRVRKEYQYLQSSLSRQGKCLRTERYCSERPRGYGLWFDNGEAIRLPSPNGLP
jgi:hypothetical protein